jgi:predicted RecA/RadA family phage recombinase
MGTVPTYATREMIRRALENAETSRDDAAIDRALQFGSRAVEELCHRPHFYPTLTTLYFDWPTNNSPTSWRLWLGQHNILSVVSLVSGGTTISASDYNLEPVNEPPYTNVQIDLSGDADFSVGDTFQRNIELQVWAGFNSDTEPAGALAEALDDSETAVDVTNSASIGVGDAVKVGDEYLVVTEKNLLDTGQNLQTGVGASTAETTIAVTTGSSYYRGEEILIGAEKMLVIDIAGNNLIVKRQWSGSTLAAHLATADIYAPRTLTVVRGALGTTAAAHDTATAITRYVPPALVTELTIAEALNNRLQVGSGYARTVGSGDNVRNASGAGLADLRDRVYYAHGRIRSAAV